MVQRSRAPSQTTTTRVARRESERSHTLGTLHTRKRTECLRRETRARKKGVKCAVESANSRRRKKRRSDDDEYKPVWPSGLWATS